jgi:tight adherence protein C
MLIFNIGILLLFAIGYLYSIKIVEDWAKDVDKKEHKLYLLYPLANVILVKTGIEKTLNRKKHVTDSIKALFVTNKPELLQKLYWCSRFSLILAILIIFDLLSLLGQLQSASNSIVLDGKYLMRPDYGEGSTQVELKVTLEKQGGTNNTDKDTDKDIDIKIDNNIDKDTDKDVDIKVDKNIDKDIDKEADIGIDKDAVKEKVSQSQELTINVRERSYSKEELSQTFEEAIQYLKICVLGSNESTELVYGDLYFCKTIPGTSITVDWKPKDYSLIQSDGSIHNEQIDEDGLVTTVTAILTYRDQQVEHNMSFHIMPRQHSEEELLRNKLEEEINASGEKSEEESRFELPDTVENYRLRWSGKEENTGTTLFFLGVLMALVAWLFGEKELDSKMTHRKEQMLLDYPEIINKFTLLVNAGMTVKQAWNKIAEDYEEKSSEKGLKKRYAYEEMLTTAHELKLGLSESTAYEQYGRRIGLIPYIKFSSLVAQNLKKGNKGFTELLRKEAIEAFEDRKETAKRLGEEAGTKLLIPMMIMLIIVFLIILIPAFWSFRM